MLWEFLAIMAVLTTASAAIKPNFVVVLTDDQDFVLNGLTPMTRTRRVIGDEGVSFVNAYTTSPICCPSRSSILTGLYVHNHGTVNNSVDGGCSSELWQSEFEPRTFGAVLRNNGYRTFYAGKYLNQYGRRHDGGGHVPVGWDWWIGLIGNSVYYNYTLSVNGSLHSRGDAQEDYLTDVLRDYSMEFLRDTSGPFLMVVSPPAPHEPFTPAERHRGTFAGMTAPRTLNFNAAVSNKHWLLRLPPETLPDDVVDRVDQIFQNRLETLLAVDELVEGIADALKRSGAWANTYVMFTSDNGFHLGQFALPWDKRQPYETDIKVPLIVSGPQLPRGQVSVRPVLNIDLAPSILDLAGVESPPAMDGKSFLREVRADESRSFLVEYHGEGGGGDGGCNHDPNVKLCHKEAACKCFDARNNTFSCIRSLGPDRNEIFCKFDDDEGFREAYDVAKDPYQMENIAEDGIDADEYEAVLKCCERRKAVSGSLVECFDLLPRKTAASSKK